MRIIYPDFFLCAARGTDLSDRVLYDPYRVEIHFSTQEHLMMRLSLYTPHSLFLQVEHSSRERESCSEVSSVYNNNDDEGRNWRSLDVRSTSSSRET